MMFRLGKMFLRLKLLMMKLYKGVLMRLILILAFGWLSQGREVENNKMVLKKKSLVSQRYGMKSLRIESRKMSKIYRKMFNLKPLLIKTWQWRIILKMMRTKAISRLKE